MGYERRTLTATEESEQATMAARLSALSEQAALDFFWQVSQRTDRRLDVLLLMGRVRLERGSHWNPAAVRVEFERAGVGPMIRLEKWKCFACWRGQARLFFHHVIEVYHNGSNTARNLVPLCFDCHQFLHPWLKEAPKAAPIAGPELAALVMSRVVDGELLQAIDDEQDGRFA